MTSPQSPHEYFFLNCTETVQVLTSTIDGLLNALEYLWEKLGIDRKEKSDRTRTLYHSFLFLINETLQKEKKLVCDVEEHVKQLLKECQDFYKLLNRNGSKVNQVCREISLLKQAEILSKELDQLKKEGIARERSLQELRATESELCSLLDLPLLIFPEPSSAYDGDYLCNLENHVKELQNIKETRLLEFHALKEELSAIENATEICFQSLFETGVNLKEGDNSIISQRNISELKDLVRKASKMMSNMEKEMLLYREELEELWDKLQVEEKCRKIFLAMYSTCKLSTLDAFKKEIQTCKGLQIKHLEEAINDARNVLIEMWNKCCVSESSRIKFHSFYDDCWSEELLKVHETEVQRLKLFYNENKSIFEKIEKWHKLWEAMIQFEELSTDPKRLNNRGGTLLQEEKKRKRLVVQLPKLETEIMNSITEYENKLGKPFTVYGENFLHFIEIQWTEHQNKKEIKRLEQKQTTLGPGSASNGRFAENPSASSKKCRSTSIRNKYSVKKTDENWASPVLKQNTNKRNCQSAEVPKESKCLQRVIPFRRILVERND